MMFTRDLGSFLDQMHEEYGDDPEYLAECLSNDIMAEIFDYMGENDITGAERASPMDVSQACVSCILAFEDVRVVGHEAFDPEDNGASTV